MDPSKEADELPADDPLAVAVKAAITQGHLSSLHHILSLHPHLPTIRIISQTPAGVESRTLLHIATDWPGNFPHTSETIAALAKTGPPVSARFRGTHTETPLHWAASNDDVAALDALLDAGADLEAPGAVLGGGSPLADAVGFKQWRAAQRLVERGAKVTLAQAAALGVTERVEEMLREMAGQREEATMAFWYACHGGRSETAKVLLRAGADINWRPQWAQESAPLDAARDAGAESLVAWLLEHGAVSGVGTVSKNQDAAEFQNLKSPPAS